MSLAELPPAAALIPAAGSGQRIGADRNKLLLPLAGRPLLWHTLRAVASAGLQQVVLVCRDDERAEMTAIAQSAGITPTFARGGATRQESVASGLAALYPTIELVAVHDGARPLVTAALFEAALRSAATHGSGVVALPAVDTLKLVEAEVITGTLDRSRVWAMQTPQAFPVKRLRQASAAAEAARFAGTDEASLLERLGEHVHVVVGSARNLKVTRPEDFALAEALIRGMDSAGQLMEPPAQVWPRIGYGFDIHETDPERPMWLGGVHIADSPFGLKGHSDADVLLHAICDAMLGALALGDIGQHFPNTDPRYAGISSVTLLEHVQALLTAHGWRVHNLDATLVAERPKLAPHVEVMRARIAEAVQMDPALVSLKATTNETLDDIGAQKGICAHAVALVVPI